MCVGTCVCVCVCVGVSTCVGLRVCVWVWVRMCNAYALLEVPLTVPPRQQHLLKRDQFAQVSLRIHHTRTVQVIIQVIYYPIYVYVLVAGILISAKQNTQ